MGTHTQSYTQNCDNCGAEVIGTEGWDSEMGNFWDYECEKCGHSDGTVS